MVQLSIPNKKRIKNMSKYEYTSNHGFLTPEEKQALKPIVMGASEKISNDLILDKLQKLDHDIKEIKGMLNDMSSELNLPLEMDIDYCEYCKANPCKNKMNAKCDGDIDNLCVPCLRERQADYNGKYVESIDANFET